MINTETSSKSCQYAETALQIQHRTYTMPMNYAHIFYFTYTCIVAYTKAVSSKSKCSRNFKTKQKWSIVKMLFALIFYQEVTHGVWRPNINAKWDTVQKEHYSTVYDMHVINAK